MAAKVLSAVMPVVVGVELFSEFISLVMLVVRV